MAAILKNAILLGQVRCLSSLSRFPSFLQVLPSTLKHAVKVQVPYFEFDKGLKAYFKKTQTYLVEDQVP